MSKVLGYGAAVLLIIGVIAYGFWSKSNTSDTQTPAAVASPTANPLLQARVRTSGQMYALLRDPEFRAIARNEEEVFNTTGRRTKLELDPIASPTIEAVDNATPDGTEDLITGHAIGLSRFRFQYNPDSREYDKPRNLSYEFGYQYDVFSTPLVAVSPRREADGLVRAGIASQRGSFTYLDTNKLITLIQTRKAWTDIGVDRPAPITALISDPAIDESGLIFMGLVAKIKIGNQAYTEAAINQIWNDLVTIADTGSLLPQNSDSLMNQFLGEGRPLAILSESQLAELTIANPQYKAQIQKDYVVMQLSPTASLSFYVIQRTQAGYLLGKLLKEHPEVRALAWKNHALRGAFNDPSLLQLEGIPANIESAVSLPNATTMSRIADKLKGRLN